MGLKINFTDKYFKAKIPSLVGNGILNRKKCRSIAFP
jgi:hypothetical protein